MNEETPESKLIYDNFPKEEFQTLYDVLNVTKDATEDEIKRGFRKCALKHHPDKGGDTEKFKALCVIHKTLSDKELRLIYDESGEIGSSSSSLGEGGPDDNGSFDEWYNYFRNLFPKLTINQIEKFTSDYKGSSEEKYDIIDAYNSHNGDLKSMMQVILLSENEDIPRFKKIINQAITDKIIKLHNNWKKSCKKNSFHFDDEVEDNDGDLVNADDDDNVEAQDDNEKQEMDIEMENVNNARVLKNKFKAKPKPKKSSVSLSSAAKKSCRKSNKSKSDKDDNNNNDLASLILKSQKSRQEEGESLINRILSRHGEGGKGTGSSLEPPDIPEEAFAKNRRR